MRSEYSINGGPNSQHIKGQAGIQVQEKIKVVTYLTIHSLSWDAQKERTIYYVCIY